MVLHLDILLVFYLLNILGIFLDLLATTLWEGPKSNRPRQPVMSNTVYMTRVEKYFSQLLRADKLSQLDSRSYRAENASH